MTITLDKILIHLPQIGSNYYILLNIRYVVVIQEKLYRGTGFFHNTLRTYIHIIKCIYYIDHIYAK